MEGGTEFKATGHVKGKSAAFHRDVVEPGLALIIEAVDLGVSGPGSFSGVGEVYSDAVPLFQGIQGRLVAKTACNKS